MPEPEFNKALRAAALTLQSKPPARFDGVTTRVFPLRANVHRLTAFCDAYLNIAPEFARFRPALPFVYLMVLDYGKMSSEVANLGWVAQHEIAFAVPLEWYSPDRDGFVFADWAVVCPFIYVDDEMSLSTGREVYGWPKARMWLRPEVNGWISDPLAAPRLMVADMMVYPELYAGKRQHPAPLFEIQQEATLAFSQVPPDPGNPFLPLSAMPGALRRWFGLLGSSLELLTRPPLLGWGGTMMDPLLSALRMGDAAVRGLWQTPSFNNITLKQFRDAEQPSRICYQALLNSTMRAQRFNGGGMLGDASLLLGDSSGGYRVLVRRYPTQPIVESLGLEPSRETVIDGIHVAILEPVLPFWLNMDLEYGVGKAICWRTKDAPWEAAATPGPVVTAPSPSPANDRHRFNTTLGGALQDVTGPFEFPNTTIRVLPLLAYDKRLEAFCAEYLANPFYRFEPWGSYVYLTVTNYEEMSSATNSVGWWADREVTFWVPVKWVDADGRLLSVAIVPVFAFANTGTAAITGSEVSGRPTVSAAILSPPNAWMKEAGPSEGTDQCLLTLKTMVLPALHLGQKSEDRVLLEIHEADALPYNDDVRWRQVSAYWGRRLVDDHRDKLRRKAENPDRLRDAKALALEVLAHGHQVNSITLKQFRDGANPDLACYQAIVRGRRAIDGLYDLREIEARLHVNIHSYPSQPVVEILGLRPKWSEMRGAVRVDVFQPIRPFWLQVSLREDLGANLCWRARSDVWQEGSPPGDLYFAPSEKRTHVGRSLLHRLEASPFSKQRLRPTLTAWREQARDEEMLTREDAARAVEAVDPQMIIESILSSEWGNWGSPRWSTGHPPKPDFCVRADSVGTDSETLFANWRRTDDRVWCWEKD